MSKELKALERIKNFMFNNAKHWKQDIAMLEKALKTLDIIKIKKVDIRAIQISNNAMEYNLMQLFGKNITKEEYDLLKEVLL